jgi:stage V sporulation protein D (sporulation-specific penicillin-binding protein)
MNEIWSNFCVSESYEPGSTFKPITVSSALETGALTGDETFYCDGGEYVTDTKINCDNVYGHGQETVIDAIKNSCNDALMQIGFKLTISDFCKYQRLFNFGSTTGIDLPNESSGVLYDEDSMHEVELATNSFGQGFTCTMIQEYAAFSAVVNGGYYYQPHLVKQILDADGGVAKNIEPLLLSQPISSRSSSILREALEAGVNEGTGKKSKVPGYRMGGKTGTAEKINPATGQRWAGRYLVSFIGAVPIDDPQVVIYVVVDEPNVEDQSTGGYAQIIARKILSEILPYLNIQPTEEITDEELANIGITWDDVQLGRQTETEAETDEDGNVIEKETETDEYGNVIESQPETDADGNEISTDESDGSAGDGSASDGSADDESAADNPNMALPPEDTGQNDAAEDGITNEELGLE